MAKNKKSNNFRLTSDSMGEMKVPSNAFYGAQTQRAVNNFPVSGISFNYDFINAVIIIKRSAAIVNSRLELLDKVGLLNYIVPENCLSGIYNHSTNKTLSYQSGHWVGSLSNQSISLGDNIRLIGANGANPYECAVNLREYNPTVNETVEQCLSDSYWCRQTVDVMSNNTKIGKDRTHYEPLIRRS